MHELVREAEAEHDVVLRVTTVLTGAYAHAYQGDAGAQGPADAGMKAGADLSDYHVGNGGQITSPRPSAAWAMYDRQVAVRPINRGARSAGFLLALTRADDVEPALSASGGR